MPSHIIHPRRDRPFQKLKLIQSERIAVTVGASSGVAGTATWDQAFPSTDYSVTALPEEATAETNLSVKVTSRSKTETVLRVANSALSERSGTIHVVALQD